MQVADHVDQHEPDETDSSDGHDPLTTHRALVKVQRKRPLAATRSDRGHAVALLGGLGHLPSSSTDPGTTGGPTTRWRVAQRPVADSWMACC